MAAHSHSPRRQDQGDFSHPTKNGHIASVAGPQQRSLPEDNTALWDGNGRETTRSFFRVANPVTPKFFKPPNSQHSVFLKEIQDIHIQADSKFTFFNQTIES